MTVVGPINVGDVFIVNQNTPAVWARVSITKIEDVPGAERLISIVSITGGRYNRAGTKGSLAESRFREICERAA